MGLDIVFFIFIYCHPLEKQILILSFVNMHCQLYSFVFYDVKIVYDQPMIKTYYGPIRPLWAHGAITL